MKLLLDYTQICAWWYQNSVRGLCTLQTTSDTLAGPFNTQIIHNLRYINTVRVSVDTFLEKSLKGSRMYTKNARQLVLKLWIIKNTHYKCCDTNYVG